MKKIQCEMVKMKVYIDEADQVEHEPLYKHILDICAKHNISGATVTKGIAGFGCRHELHEDRFLRLSRDLPIIIEVIDTDDNILSILPEVYAVMQGGMVTRETVQVTKFLHQNDK